MFDCSLGTNKNGAVYSFFNMSQRKWPKQWGCFLLTCSSDIALLKIDIISFIYGKEILFSTLLSPIIQLNHSHLGPVEDIQLIRYVTYIWSEPFTVNFTIDVFRLFSPFYYSL